MTVRIRGFFLLLFLSATTAYSARTEADTEFVYTVRPGDRYSAIIVTVLKLQDTSRWKPFGKAVAEFNGLSDMDLIRPGQKIRFPAIRVVHPEQTDLKTLVKRYFNGHWDRRSDIVIHRTEFFLIILRDIRFLESGRI